MNSTFYFLKIDLWSLKLISHFCYWVIANCLDLKKAFEAPLRVPPTHSYMAPIVAIVYLSVKLWLGLITQVLSFLLYRDELSLGTNSYKSFLFACCHNFKDTRTISPLVTYIALNSWIPPKQTSNDSIAGNGRLMV